MKITSRLMPRKECDLLKCHSAQFGLSVANIGDLDQDGFNGKNLVQLT